MKRPVDPYDVDTYERIGVVVRNRALMDGDAWFAQLGAAWSCCDNIFSERHFLRRALLLATRRQLDLMMTAEEVKALRDMPMRIEVWRGCYPINRGGLSWSTDPKVAANFPSLRRFRRDGEPPILQRGYALRRRVVFKNDLKEAEIIAPKVFGIVEDRL